MSFGEAVGKALATIGTWVGAGVIAYLFRPNGWIAFFALVIAGSATGYIWGHTDD